MTTLTSSQHSLRPGFVGGSPSSGIGPTRGYASRFDGHFQRAAEAARTAR